MTDSVPPSPQVSPDGKWIAYQSNETGRAEIYVKSFPEGPGKWQVSTDGGLWPRWRGDGKELYFVAAPNVMAADIQVTGGSVQPGVPRSLFTLTADPSLTAGQPVGYLRYAVAPDGQRFLIPVPMTAGTAAPASGGTADALMVAADSVAGSSPADVNGAVTVVLNWLSMIEGAEKPKR
jgi:hypothetical protein